MATSTVTRDSNAPAMLVVVHDVSSIFLNELEHIADRLDPLLGSRMSAAIVPSWHGTHACRSNTAYRALLSRFSEHLLHGWTHLSAQPLRPLSLLTGSADELRGLDELAILHRVARGQDEFRELMGREAEGFLPPAWQLPIRASRLSRLKFVLRFGRLEPCGAQGTPQALATFSWDWGRLGWLGYAGECLGHLQRCGRQAVPCVAIHPVDVRRGFFERAVRLIETLVHSGHRPVSAAELVCLQEAGA